MLGHINLVYSFMAKALWLVCFVCSTIYDLSLGYVAMGGSKFYIVLSFCFDLFCDSKWKIRSSMGQSFSKYTLEKEKAKHSNPHLSMNGALHQMPTIQHLTKNAYGRLANTKTASYRIWKETVPSVRPSVRPHSQRTRHASNNVYRARLS